MILLFCSSSEQGQLTTSLHSARTYASLTVSTDENVDSTRFGAHEPVALTQEEKLVSLQQCGQHANEIIRAVNGWSPDYMAYSSPFIICALFGPACLHFLSHKISTSRPEVGRINRELVGLVFAQFARYWNLGRLLLGGCFLQLDCFARSDVNSELMHRMEKLDITSNLSFNAPDKPGIAKRFAGILPDKDINKANKPPGFLSGHRNSFQSISMAA